MSAAAQPLIVVIALFALFGGVAIADRAAAAEPPAPSEEGMLVDAGVARSTPVVVAEPPREQPRLEVAWQGDALLTGRLALLTVTVGPHTAPIESLGGTLGRRDVLAWATADPRRWLALAPVDVDERLLQQRLELAATLQDGVVTVWRKPVPIAEAPYDRRNITVARQFTSPSKRQAQRAAKEAAELARVLDGRSPERLFRGSFAKPVPKDETSPFGTKRLYNNKRSNRHLGLDLNGDVGDPISAANRGKVVLATERFYSGGTVVIDHGQGLFSMYFHMSKIIAKPGDLVEKGQLIGLVGATGQVTGPHLHFSIKLDGLYQDPKYALLLDLSDDPLDVASPDRDAGPAAHDAGIAR